MLDLRALRTVPVTLGHACDSRAARRVAVQDTERSQQDQNDHERPDDSQFDPDSL